MNKKIKLGLFVFIFIGIILVSIIYYFKKPKEVKRKRKQNEIAILIKENGADNYIKSTSKDIPKGDYTLNYEKSYCKNNGVIGDYDNTLGKVSFSFVGTDSCFLYFDYSNGKIGYQKILLDNGLGATNVEIAKTNIENKGTPDFSKIADTDEGMYAMDDNYTLDGGMKSYYYRGAISNNWLKYGKYIKDVYYYDTNELYETCPDGKTCNKIASAGDDIYWRIVRINGDGSIRILWSGKDAPTESTKVVKLDTNNKEYTHSLLFEHMNSSSGNNNELTNYIFDNFASTYTNIFDTNIVVNSNFCQPTKMFNDIEMTSEAQDQDDDGLASVCGYGQPLYIFPLASRLYNNNPVFACQNNEEIVSSKSSGLIGDEIITAGLNVKFNLNIDSDFDGNGFYTTLIKGLDENKNFYLYNGTYYLSSTLFAFGECSAMPYRYAVVTNDGSFNYSTNSGHLRPVISLTPSVKLSGNGTWNNVYEVVN